MMLSILSESALIIFAIVFEDASATIYAKTKVLNALMADESYSP